MYYTVIKRHYFLLHRLCDQKHHSNYSLYIETDILLDNSRPILISEIPFHFCDIFLERYLKGEMKIFSMSLIITFRLHEVILTVISKTKKKKKKSFYF